MDLEGIAEAVVAVKDGLDRLAARVEDLERKGAPGKTHLVTDDVMELMRETRAWMTTGVLAMNLHKPVNEVAAAITILLSQGSLERKKFVDGAMRLECFRITTAEDDD